MFADLSINDKKLYNWVMKIFKNPWFKNFVLILLQTLIFIAGTVAFVALLWEPHVEGRNAQKSFFEVYFNDTFLIFIYLASIPFFVGLYQIFRVLGYLRNHKLLTKPVIEAVRVIKY